MDERPAVRVDIEVSRRRDGPGFPVAPETPIEASGLYRSGSEVVMETLRDAVGPVLDGAIARWDHIYARGFGDGFDGAPPRAKHYVVAGLVADACGHRPRVLEVGCGFGTTYRLLRKLGPIYRGIDVSTRAVQRCRDHWGADPACAFDVASFDRDEPLGVFDAVILDEAIQGFPVAMAKTFVEKAMACLAGPRSVLVISLSTPIRGRLFWAACRHLLPAPHQRIEVHSGPMSMLGARSVVLSFTQLRLDEQEERAAPPVSGVEAPVSRWWTQMPSDLSRTPRPARSATAPNRTRQR